MKRKDPSASPPVHWTVCLSKYTFSFPAASLQAVVIEVGLPFMGTSGGAKGGDAGGDGGEGGADGGGVGGAVGGMRLTMFHFSQ